MPIKKRLVMALLLFISAMSMRIYYLDQTIPDAVLRGDAISYWHYGMNMAQHGVFSKQAPDSSVLTPDSFWAPGFPALIALTASWVNPEQVIPTIFYIHAVLGGATAALTLLLGCQFMPVWASVAATVLYALNPHSIAITNNLLTETLFSFVLMLAIFCYGSARKTNSFGWTIGAGASFGIAYLANPVVFFLPFLLAAQDRIAVKSIPQDRARASRYTAVFLCAFLLFPSAWSVRNTLSVPASSQSSGQRALDNFIIGAHADFFDRWRANPRDPDNPATVDRVRYKAWTDFLPVWGERLVNKPGAYLYWYIIGKPQLLFGWNIMIGYGDIYVYAVTTSPYMTSKPMILSYVLMKAMHPWLMLCAAIGIFMGFSSSGRHTHHTSAHLAVTLIYVALVYIVLQAEPRYSIPLRPELYLCAMFCLYRLAEKYRASKKQAGRM